MTIWKNSKKLFQKPLALCAPEIAGIEPVPDAQGGEVLPLT